MGSTVSHPVHAVTFDAGGTLLTPRPSVGHVYAEVAAEHGLAVEPENLNRRFKEAWRAKVTFDYSVAAWRELVRFVFGELIAGDISESLFQDLYNRFRQPSAWYVFEDVRPTLSKLRECGLKLGLISNWDDRLGPLLNALELDSFFDSIVISSDLGYAKPDPRIFQRAQQQLQVRASEILHVGDSQGEDVEAARGAGFQAVLLERHRRATSSVASLAELPGLVIP